MSDRPRTPGRPLFTAEAVFATLGVLAFGAGITKRWILDPVGEAFNSLSPDAKAAVAVLVVGGVALAIAFARLAQQRNVQAARRAVEARISDVGGAAGVPAVPAGGPVDAT